MSDQEIIVFLCKEEEITRERKGYFEAFNELGYEVRCSGEVNYSIGNPIFLGNVKLIIQPEASPILPFDIFELKIPVVCFQIDTNLAAKQRARASVSFDATFVFHPGFEFLFKKWGVSNTYLLPHAIERKIFLPVNSEKKYQIGWVGRTDGNNYKTRRQILPILHKRFTMNDPFRQYSQSEMIDVYSQSSMVVNISKDDFLQDANIRCFEAMASGALLFTFLPTELEKIGFADGEHFIGFQNETDLIMKLDQFLQDPGAASRIAKNASDAVLQYHTYHNRANQILKTVSSLKVKKNTRKNNANDKWLAFANFFLFRREFSKSAFSWNQIGFTLEKVKLIPKLTKLYFSNIIYQRIKLSKQQ